MTELSALAEALRRIPGPKMGIGIADPCAPAPPLWSAEAAASGRMRPNRLREFAAGRAAARAAMAQLGVPVAAIPMGPDRAPIWPEGVTGSISHCATAALAVVMASTGAGTIGVDIEEATGLDPDLWETVLTPTERDWVRTLPRETQAQVAKRAFCAKEAVYKAQYPQTGRVIGFEDVELTPHPTGFTATLAQTATPTAPVHIHCLDVLDWMVSLVILPGQGAR